MSKPVKRILLTVHQYFPEYSAGTEVLTRSIACGLMNRGIHVDVLACVHSNQPRDYRLGGLRHEEQDGVDVWKLEYNFFAAPEPMSCEYANPYTADFMDSFLQTCKPDLVHIMHTYRLSASVIEVYRRHKLSIIYTATDFWFLCPLIQLRDVDNNDCRGPRDKASNCIYCFFKQNNTPAASCGSSVSSRQIDEIVANETNADLKRFYASITAFQRPRLENLVSKLNQIYRILVPTDTMKELLVENGVDEKKIQKFPFALQDNQLRPDCPRKELNGTLSISYIGTIIEHKGVHILIKAFKKMRNVNATLKIYGDTSIVPAYYKHLQELIDNDPSIQFMGTFPNDRISEVMDHTDVLVVPSIWYENTPLVILSAFASHVPVVATDVGGLTEMVKHDKNGLTFPKGDSDELARQLMRFFDEPELLKRLSEGIPSIFSMTDYINGLMDLYKQAINQQIN